MSISGGNACIDSSSGGYANDYVVIFARVPITGNGVVKTWCLHVFRTGGGQVRLKIFRVVGSIMKYIGESTLKTLSSGLNTFTNDVSIPVYSGDIIGLYSNNSLGNPYVNTTDGSNATYYISLGNITTDTNVSDWGIGLSTGIYSVHVDGDSALSDVYVDLNKSDDTGAGTSWATAKKTMQAGWDILNSTGTMHVASGDYSAQTTIAYDKSWKLSCEDPNVTGVKNVKIPKST